MTSSDITYVFYHSVSILRKTSPCVFELKEIQTASDFRRKQQRLFFLLVNFVALEVKIKVIPQQVEVAQGVPGRFKAPDILDARHYKGGGGSSSAIRTGRLYPRRNPWYSFPETESTPGHMVLSVGATEKNPSDTTGNRSRDRPTSSALRHPRPQY